MSRIYAKGTNDEHETAVNIRKYVKTDQLQVVEISGAPTPDFSLNLLVGSGIARQFDCDVMLDTTDGYTRTRFYDTSGAPNGTEPLLWGFLSSGRKVGSSTLSFDRHSLTFPGEGLHFEHGVGILCQVVTGTATIDGVEAILYYQPK